MHERRARRARCDGGARRIEIGQATGIDDGIEVVGELALAGVGSSQVQEPDVDAAGLTQVEAGVEESQARRKAVRGNRSSRNTGCRKACGFLTRAWTR